MSSFGKSPEISSWMRDDAVECCRKCKLPFTIWRRRHHCRLCLHIFCSKCSNYKTVITPVIGKGQTQTTQDSIKRTYAALQSSNTNSSISAFFGLGYIGQQESRVCKRCLRKASRIQMASRFIILTALNQFIDVRDWSKMAQVCRIWRAGCDFLHSRWKSLQKQIVLGKQITYIDRMLLIQNAPYVFNHPLLECRLYQTGTMMWKTRMKHTYEILHIDKNGNEERPVLSCKQIKCRNAPCGAHNINVMCQRLMYLPCTHESFKHAIWTLQQQSPLVLQSMVAFLMWIGMRKHVVLKSVPAIVHSACYWYCRAHAQLKQHKHHFENSHTQHTEAFVCGFLEFMREGEEDIQHTCFLERTIASQRPYLPYELTNGTGWRVEQMLFGTKRRLSSATRPFVVDIVVSRQIDGAHQQKTKTLMLKREQVDTDFIVMSCQRFLQSRSVHLKAYYVAPLQAQTKPYSLTGSSSGAGYGLVLFDNGVTLKEVQDSYNNSIAEYVMAHNPNQTIKNIQTNFYKSCASQSLLMLLFQTGDRHLQNILVSASGRLYHIDFGFLWSEPVLSSKMAQLGRQTIRMTPAMLGLIGRRYHKHFVDECKRVNRIIRLYISAIFAIVWPLTQQIGTMDVETLQQNIEKYLCSSCVDTAESQDLLIETLLKQSSQSAGSLGTVFGTAVKIKDSVSALLGSSPVIAAGRVQQVVTSGVTAALAIRSLFGIP